MSKIFAVSLSALLLPVFFTITAASVSADPQTTCSVRTEQPNDEPLTDETRKARFIVNVGNNSNYGLYKMEFKCAAFNTKENATKLGANEIYYDLDKSFYSPGNTPCEFSGGQHEIWVKAVVNNQEVDQCRAFYNVIEADTQCKLEIDPSSGITAETDLRVSGTNLIPGGQFRLFFDNNNLTGNLETPSFSGVQIPTEKLSLGKHKIDIRRANFEIRILPQLSAFGPPLCPIEFTVGTPDQPGGILPPGSTTLICPGDRRCTSAGGLECDPAKPAIKTAIGCIHTNPGDLIQDVLKFGLGIAGGLAFLMMILGAFQMLTSAGNPDTLQAGRERLTSAVIGLLIVIFAVLLLQIIGFDILGLPEFGR